MAVLDVLDERMDDQREVGFTAADRKSLNILENEMSHVVESLKEVSIRLAKLEDAKISARDLEQTYIEVDELRQKKADQAVVDGVLKDHEARLRNLERRVWMAVGGGAIVVGLLEALHRFGV